MNSKNHHGFKVLFFFVLITKYLLICSSVRSAEVSSYLIHLNEQKSEIMLNFGKSIASCVRRKDTNHSAFNGCIDWHSAVHGVWALIAISRATGTKEFDFLISNTLKDNKLSKELFLLKNHQNFEMPYGRAWFLRLSIDYEKHYSTKKLRVMADYIFKSMLLYLKKQHKTILSGSYESVSWSLIHMLDYARFTKNKRFEKDVLKLIKKRYPLDKLKCETNSESGNFMAVCTNILSLASRILNRLEFIQWQTSFIDLNHLPNFVKKTTNWHHYGLNFSRAWGLWDAYDKTGDPRYLKVYVEHFISGLNPHSNWNGNYRGVGHWVGQFGVFAIQPLFGSKGR